MEDNNISIDIKDTSITTFYLNYIHKMAECDGQPKNFTITLQGTSSALEFTNIKMINPGICVVNENGAGLLQYDEDTIFGMPNYTFSASNMKFLYLSDGTFVKFHYNTPYTDVINSCEDNFSPYTSATAVMLKEKIVQICVDNGRDGGPILSYKNDDFWDKFKEYAKTNSDIEELYDKVKYKEVWSEEGLRDKNYGYEIKPFEIIRYEHVENDEYALVKDYREKLNDAPYYLIHLNHTVSDKIDLSIDEFVYDISMETRNKILDKIVNNHLTYFEAKKIIKRECKRRNPLVYKLNNRNKNFRKKYL